MNNTMTINIDIPSGTSIDIGKLTAMAKQYVQQYVYAMQKTRHAKPNNVKPTSAFRNMRGILSSTLSYDEMKEIALSEKYDV